MKKMSGVKLSGKKLLLLAVLGTSPILAGCSGLGDSMGFGRNPPDEFAVVDRAPLAIPPEFELRPPQPGAPRPQEMTTKARAEEKLFNINKEDESAPAKKDADRSDVESSLLASAGAPKADPQIRTVIDREAAQKISGSERFIDELLWWRKPVPPATTVDAEAEAQRLKEAKEKGATVTTGGTPVIERQKSGFLGL